MAYNSTRSGVIGLIAGLATGLVLLVVELLLTLLIYTALNLYTNTTFGYLAAMSKWLGDIAFSWVFFLLPGLTNTAYATLVGDFSPKAILLLLIGLLVAGVVRGTGAVLRRR